MNLSRWKLLAGVFGFSVCGLAALAEPACRNGAHGEHRQLPTVAETNPASGAKVSPPPIAVQPPKPQDVKPTPAPAPLPSLPPAIELPKPTESPKPTETKLPSETATKPSSTDPVELTLPMIGGEKPKAEALPALPIPGSPAKTENPNIPGSTAVPDPVLPPATGTPALPIPTPGVTNNTGTLPLPPPNPNPTPTQTLPSVGGLPPLPQSTPGTLPPSKSEPTLPLPLPSTGSTSLPPVAPGQSPSGTLPLPSDSGSVRGNAGLTLPVPSTTPAPLTPPLSGSADLPPPPPTTNTVRTVESRSPSQVVEKRLKVTLQMGEGNPRFEIRDGEEVVLKVVSDKIDVKAPTEKGDLWSTLKASGRVRFQSPGGDGYCDELQIIPGSCEVIATGKVQFKYNWGKVETAVTSERMTFRLGATPETR